MARRRRRKIKPGKRRGPGHNEANKATEESRSRERMIHQGKEDYFRYDAREILEGAGMDEEMWRPIIQTLYAQGSRNSIKEAKLWLDEKATELGIGGEEVRGLKKILDSYSKWR